MIIVDANYIHFTGTSARYSQAFSFKVDLPPDPDVVFDHIKLLMTANSDENNWKNDFPVTGFVASYEKPQSEFAKRRYYFAECADDILTPQAAKNLAQKLLSIPGADLFSARAQWGGLLIKQTAAEYPSAHLFLLQGRIQPLVIAVEPDDWIIDRKTGQVYFPFPVVTRQDLKVTGTCPMTPDPLQPS